MVGLIFNAARSHPLPLDYVPKDQRLNTEIAAMVPADKPAPQLATASQADLPADMTLADFSRVVDAHTAVIIDARPGLFYRLGHVPGALSLPREDFRAAYERNKGRLTDKKDAMIVVYCSSNSCEDAGMVRKALLELGHQGTVVFAGGWAAWQEAGQAEEKQE